MRQAPGAGRRRPRRKSSVGGCTAAPAPVLLGVRRVCGQDVAVPRLGATLPRPCRTQHASLLRRHLTPVGANRVQRRQGKVCGRGGVFTVDEDDAKQRDAGGWGVALLGRGGSAGEVN